jgi:hypothetical protein
VPHRGHDRADGQASRGSRLNPVTVLHSAPATAQGMRNVPYA